MKSIEMVINLNSASVGKLNVFEGGELKRKQRNEGVNENIQELTRGEKSIGVAARRRKEMKGGR